MKKIRYAASFFIVLCGMFMGITAFKCNTKESQSGKEAIQRETQVNTEVWQQMTDENETETELEIVNETEFEEMENTVPEQENMQVTGQEKSVDEAGEDTQDEQSIPEEEMQPEEPQPELTDWVQSLRIAGQASQLLVVSASGTQAEITLHNRDQNGNWYQAIQTSGFVGRDGVGQTSEYNQKSPAGIYNFSMAFGILPDPGSQITYTQVDESDYWVDDPASQYYNQFVSTNAVQQDWNSAEHLISVAPAYDYALALNYNAACVPGNGSAIFLHVSTGRSTAGCISVPENIMISFLQNITPECVVIIANSSDLMNY